MVKELKAKLAINGISFNSKEDGISIALPFEFGELEFFDQPNNDDILLLSGEDWHTHSSVEGGLEGIFTLIQKILNGEFLLIKETSSEGGIAKRIEAEINEYLKWLPQGYTYVVYNGA
jgi:hypothetical protein